MYGPGKVCNNSLIVYISGGFLGNLIIMSTDISLLENKNFIYISHQSQNNFL